MPMDKTRIVCVEAKTGKSIWSFEGYAPSNQPGMSILGDSMFGWTEEKGCQAFALSLKGAEPRFSIPKTGHPYTVPVTALGKYVFAFGELLGESPKHVFTADIATGKIVGKLDGAKHLPGNGGYVEAIGDLVLVRYDGTHGGMEFGFYKIGADGSIVQNGTWAPNDFGGRAATTSYHQAIMYPLAEGRAFLRQYDGIYCYDLRKP
jgi:outer membrane protein assembly factor BamB